MNSKIRSACELGGAIGAIRNVSEATVVLFRSVSSAEFKGVLSTGTFSAVGSSVEGKYFAESLGDAAVWGRQLGNPHIIEVTFPKSVADQLYRWDRLDGIGPARFGTLDQLRNYTIRQVR